MRRKHFPAPWRHISMAHALKRQTLAPGRELLYRQRSPSRFLLIRIACMRFESLTAALFSRRSPRALIVQFLTLGALTLPLGACSTVESLNPFGGGEKYETKLLPDIPAETLYNQGLGRLQKNDSAGAVKKFGAVEKQFPFSQWTKKALLMTV